jgi:hypothetical protein
VHESLNDLLLVPIFVPLMIAVVDRLGLRRRGDPPAFGEVLMPLLTVSLAFEVWLPSMRACGDTCFADPSDMGWYAAGAVMSAAWWHVWSPSPAVGES